MRFYKIEPPTAEDTGEGEDTSEWFTSLRAAKKRFSEIMRECNGIQRDWETSDAVKNGLETMPPFRFTECSLEQVLLRDDLPPREMLLAVLNRKGFIRQNGHKLIRTAKVKERSDRD